MKFTRVDPDENFPSGKWVSENNIWELGFCPVMYGVRVRFSRVGNGWVNLDYCAGDSAGFALILLATVARILEPLPESVTGAEIERLFPRFEVKPIDRDPICWTRLQELAELASLGELSLS